MSFFQHQSNAKSGHSDNPYTARVGLSVLMALLLAGCSDGNDNFVAGPTEPPVEAETPFQEIYDQGVTRYLGEYSPMATTTEGNITNHIFGTGDGPQCLVGGEYTMATRPSESEDLVIFLQGGGACWSEFCAANLTADSGIPEVGILDPNRDDNPVKDWNVAFLPYCDGGLFASDADRDSDGDGVNEFTQRGLHNLSAGLDVTRNTFPAPRRIFLIGASAGGLGTSFALPLVRSLYPGIAIDVLNDSGVGVGRPDTPEFQALLIDDWNTRAFFPASCENNCLAPDGHLTDYHDWQMGQDPNLRRGFLSYTQDTVFADVFLRIGGPAFEAALIPEMEQAEAAAPERVRSWIPIGNGHTFVQAEPEQTAGGVKVLDWIGLMLDNSPEWVSVAD
jgi:hypothetical protein